MTQTALATGRIHHTLSRLRILGLNSGVSTGETWLKGEGPKIESFSPVDGNLIATVASASFEEYQTVVSVAQKAFDSWRLWPAPKRGEVVRQFGEELRKMKPELGKLVSYEMGKSYQEGLGEVQEMIDICDFAVGLSRQLNGCTIPSERTEHRSSGTPWGWLALLARSISLSLFGAGMRRLLGSAET